MKKNKSVAVVLILMIIICHLLVTFFKVNTDYFKYNYKFDKSEIVEAEVFYKQRKTIKQSRNRINLNFWYNGESVISVTNSMFPLTNEIVLFTDVRPLFRSYPYTGTFFTVLLFVFKIPLQAMAKDL